MDEYKISYEKQIKFFSEYFYILLNILNKNNIELNTNELQLNTDEIFIVFIYKKITYTVINSKLSNFKEEKEIFEYFETLIKYLSKSIHNTSELINFCLNNSELERNNSIKEGKNKIVCFILENIIQQIKLKLKGSRVLTSIFSNRSSNDSPHPLTPHLHDTSSSNLFFKLIKLFSNFNKSIFKEYNYEKYSTNGSLICDLLSQLISIDSVGEFIQMQKSFNAIYIKNQIKEKISNSIEKNKYNLDEIFDEIKIIIKDNYQFIICFRNDPVLFEYATEQIFFSCLKDILNIYRNSYNEEIQIFSLKKKISKVKILFLLDLIIKFLIYVNKLNENLEKRKNPNSKISSSSINSILSEIQKLTENYSIIISKELRTNGFNDLVSLFTYDNLMRLSEENISDVFTKIKNQIKNLFSDLEYIKVTIETENYFFNSFLTILISKINEECELSLKRAPKSKYFSTLSDKTLRIFDQLLSRYTISSNTINHINKPLRALKNNLSSLNMNKL